MAEYLKVITASFIMSEAEDEASQESDFVALI